MANWSHMAQINSTNRKWGKYFIAFLLQLCHFSAHTAEPYEQKEMSKKFTSVSIAFM